MSSRPLTRSEVETAIARRGADVYAGFLRPHLRPDMAVLDCGCGEATIALGLAEAVPDGRVVGVDLDQSDLTIALRYAAAIERSNLVFAAADGRRLPFGDAVFDAVLCHSVLETLDDPAGVVTELRRVTKPGGLVGAASVDYGGIILGSEHAVTPAASTRFANNYGDPRGSLSRKWGGGSVGCSRQRDSAGLTRSPITSATGRSKGYGLLRATGPRNAATENGRPWSHVTKLHRSKSCSALPKHGKRGAAIRRILCLRVVSRFGLAIARKNRMRRLRTGPDKRRLGAPQHVDGRLHSMRGGSAIDRFVVISGCSGGGKSTLLEELRRRGYATVEEPGRRIVKEQLLSGGTALPWIDAVAFARCAIAMALSDRKAARRLQGSWVFFDRGLVDASIALRHLTGEPALSAIRRSHRYHRRVFLAPPWPEIYVTDSERRHGLDAGVAEYQRLTNAYPALGYEVTILPKVHVAERAEFVLRTLAG